MRSITFDTDYLTRTMLVVAFFCFALLIVTAPAAYVDDRTLYGINLWIKPLKFDLAIMVHAVTVAMIAQLLTREKRGAISLRVLAFLFVVAAAFENVYITIQAMRGRASHFNYETVPEQALYAAMGVGAILLILLPFVIGVHLAFQRGRALSGLRLGAILGCVLGPPLTLAYAGYMSMSGGHFVGAPAGYSDAGGAFFFGWSRDVGDLRPSHFVALHMIQSVPIAGYIGDRLSHGAGRIAAIATAIFMAALSTFLFVQALGGAPFWPR